MATLERLEQALRNADAAGDTDAAKAFAAEIRKMRSQAPMSKGERFTRGLRDPIDGGAQLLTNVLPTGVVQAGNRVNNWLADNTGLVGRLPEGGVDQQVREAERDYESRKPEGMDWMRTAGNIASPANLAMMARLPTAATTLGRIGIGAAAGAGSAALAPVGADDFADEKLKQVGLGAATGGVLSPVLGGVARVVSPNASKNPDVRKLVDAGVRPTIGQTLGGRANALEEKMMSVPIVGDAIASARNKTLEQFNRAAIGRATAPIGASVDDIGQAGVARAGDALSDAYQTALSSVKSVKFDQQFAQDFTQLRSMTRNLAPGLRSKFDKTAREVFGGRTSPAGAMTGTTYKKVDSELGEIARRYQGSTVASEAEFGDAVSQLKNLMQEQMKRSNPSAAEALKAADSGWANLVRVEGAAKAAKNSGGVFTPGQLNMAIQTADRSTRKRAVARGTALMQDLGSAGQNVIGNKVPNSGTTDRMLAATVGGYFLDPMVPVGLLGSAGLYTQPVQSLLRGAVTMRPQFAEPVADALRKASPGLLFPAAQISAGLLE